MIGTDIVLSPQEKFARYVELVESADSAMDRAIELQTPDAWRAAEAKNSDAVAFWVTELRDCAPPEAKVYHEAHVRETLTWTIGHQVRG